MNSSIIDQDPQWMRLATEDELREFLQEHLDKMAESPRKLMLQRAFDEECDRRSGRHYERVNGGEWI